ncbi:MAG: T9SS type A sorting domain-containing protein [Bacteroidia bacterium]
MKRLIFLLLLTLTSALTTAQSFCFYDPNTGPLYSNGSSGAIYDAISADFNSDGHLDIVTANSVAGNISFIPGYGNGTLGNPDTIHLAPTLFCISKGYYNNDTLPDLAAANSGSIFVMMGNGNGTFQPYTAYAAGGYPSRIYSRDINGDGFPDLLEADQYGVVVLMGQANGTFLPAITYSTGGSCDDLCIADCDNDGILDVVSTTLITSTYSEINFLKGNGNGTFASSTTVSSMNYPYNFIAGITSGDLDGDGKTDLVVANSSNSVHRVEVYSGNGNGTFTTPVYYPTSYNPFYIYLSDMDNDGIKDIVTEEGNGFTVLKGNSNGTFNPYQYFLAMTTPNTLVIGDFNEDGRTDLIIPSAYFGSPLIAVNLNCSTMGINATENSVPPLSVFPNPFNSTATLKSCAILNKADLVIYNSYGQKVRTLTALSGDKAKIEREELPAGIYFIQIIQGAKITAKGKFVIAD